MALSVRRMVSGQLSLTLMIFLVQGGASKRCYVCNSGEADKPNKNCPASGITAPYLVHAEHCENHCFVRTYNHIPGVIYRGCTDVFPALPKTLPENGCNNYFGDEWCFCVTDFCNKRSINDDSAENGMIEGDTEYYDPKDDGSDDADDASNTSPMTLSTKPRLKSDQSNLDYVGIPTPYSESVQNNTLATNSSEFSSWNTTDLQYSEEDIPNNLEEDIPKEENLEQKKDDKPNHNSSNAFSYSALLVSICILFASTKY